jgi:hypothetical protein
MPKFGKQTYRHGAKDNPTNSNQPHTSKSTAKQPRTQHFKKAHLFSTCMPYQHLSKQLRIVYKHMHDPRNKIKYKLFFDSLYDINYYTKITLKLRIAAHPPQKQSTPDINGQQTVTQQKPANAWPMHPLKVKSRHHDRTTA